MNKKYNAFLKFSLLVIPDIRFNHILTINEQYTNIFNDLQLQNQQSYYNFYG